MLPITNVTSIPSNIFIQITKFGEPSTGGKLALNSTNEPASDNFIGAYSHRKIHFLFIYFIFIHFSVDLTCPLSFLPNIRGQLKRTIVS